MAVSFSECLEVRVCCLFHLSVWSDLQPRIAQKVCGKVEKGGGQAEAAHLLRWSCPLFRFMWGTVIVFFLVLVLLLSLLSYGELEDFQYPEYGYLHGDREKGLLLFHTAR